jgi:hypothetical protein
MRVIFVGLNPARPGPTLSGALRRLGRWADSLGIGTFSFTNAFYGSLDHPDLQFLGECVEGHDRVIALGNVASSCLHKLGIEHFKMPHPSGRNRLLNDREYELAMIERCREYLRGEADSDQRAQQAPVHP